MALAGAVGGGCEEREAEFLLAADAARVNRRLAGGITAGEEAFDDAGGEGESSAGRLVEEEEEVGEGEASADSLGGTLKLA